MADRAQRNGKATMADVARRAGVSPATVARVLYSNGYVVAQKRAIVEEAIRDTGYRPNIMARALRTRRSFTIGMVVSGSRLNAFHSYVAHEVQLEAIKHRYSVLTLNNGLRASVEHAGVQGFLDQHVGAVVFCAAVDPDNVRLVVDAGIPTVQIEREILPGGNLVLVDPRPGMEQAISHLVELGHTRIAYIGGETQSHHLETRPDRSAELQRVAAYETALAKWGLETPADFILSGPYYAEDGKRQTGYLLMRELLDRKVPPTAVVTGADLLAAGALQAISDRGLSVPGDISLIGYDNTMAEVLTPPLTSIAQPIPELGRTAVQLVLETIRNPEVSPTSKVFKTHLVRRASTAIVARHIDRRLPR
jgi:LacI family transcriptional regulator